jgi:2-haloacid dehalogenase
MDAAIRTALGARLPSGPTGEAFLTVCEAYRFDEVLGPYQPYREVVANALRRTATRFGVEFSPADGADIYDQVPGWGPHPGVPEALGRLSKIAPLVILSNAADEQIHRNVDLLGAPFAFVITAEQARAYKPRLAAFEFMFDRLGCRPDEVIHVSSSYAYDIRPAVDAGVSRVVYLNRGYETRQPWLTSLEVQDLSELADMLEG